MTARHTLYVASGNAGKLRDFATAAEASVESSLALAGRCEFTLRALPGLESISAPAEDDLTFAGNARAKAIYYSLQAPGSLVIADDSGLEVDALGGAPGVYSARYAQRAGAPRDEPDSANNLYLLAELARVLAPDGVVADLERRTARYRCVLAAARDGVCLCTAEGSLAGQILLEPRGQQGFGYDPLFYLPALKQTMAEVDPTTRLRLSHRGEALRALLPRLAELLGGPGK
jgi:XTP/dITP diphosphohydrolase